MSRAASLPGAELFSKKSFFFEEATCPGQLRCLGQIFSRKSTFLKKPLVLGSFAAWGRFFPENRLFYKKPLVPGSFAAWGRFVCQKIDFLKKPLVPGNFAAWGRFCSRKTGFQEFWDYWAQNKTSEISKNALPEFLGLLCAKNKRRKYCRERELELRVVAEKIATKTQLREYFIFA